MSADERPPSALVGYPGPDGRGAGLTGFGAGANDACERCGRAMPVRWLHHAWHNAEDAANAPSEPTT